MNDYPEYIMFRGVRYFPEVKQEKPRIFLVCGFNRFSFQIPEKVTMINVSTTSVSRGHPVPMPSPPGCILIASDILSDGDEITVSPNMTSIVIRDKSGKQKYVVRDYDGMYVIGEGVAL